MVEYNCSETVATLGLSFFVVGLGIGPMLLGPLSYVPPSAANSLYQLTQY
jgi:hypothetical protein